MICILSSWCHCHTIISCFTKIQCQLTQVVLETRPLNGCLLLLYQIHRLQWCCLKNATGTLYVVDEYNCVHALWWISWEFDNAFWSPWSLLPFRNSGIKCRDAAANINPLETSPHMPQTRAYKMTPLHGVRACVCVCDTNTDWLTASGILWRLKRSVAVMSHVVVCWLCRVWETNCLACRPWHSLRWLTDCS